MAILNFITQQLPSREALSLELDNPNGFEVVILDSLGRTLTLNNVSNIEWNVEKGIAYFASKIFGSCYRPEIVFLKEVTITFAICKAELFSSVGCSQHELSYAGV